jgi:hypothetical protein
MNDLSVLYPLATTSSQMEGYLKGTSKTAGGDLLPVALFDAVTGTKTPKGTDGVTDGDGTDGKQRGRRRRRDRRREQRLVG